MARRKAIAWCAFEVTNDKLEGKVLADLIGYVLETINESEEPIGIEFKGCTSKIVDEGEDPPLVPDEVELPEGLKEPPWRRLKDDEQPG